MIDQLFAKLFKREWKYISENPFYVGALCLNKNDIVMIVNLSASKNAQYVTVEYLGFNRMISVQKFNKLFTENKKK